MKCTRIEMAEIIGKDARTLDKMVEAGCPYVTRPGEAGSKQWMFDTASVIAWMVDGQGEQEQKDRDKESKSKQLAAEAGIKWMEFGEKKKALIHITDILPPIFEAVSIVKSRIQAVPGRLAQQVAVETDAAACQRILKDELDDALTALNADFEKALRGE